MQHLDTEHHDGTSDATPGGELDKRRPGELVFAVILLCASLGLLWSAYGIENPFGPNGLSAPRAIPVATTLIMVFASAFILFKTAKLPLDLAESVSRDIFPAVVVLFAAMLAAYGILVKPLGFLPTSALFLIVGIKRLSRRSWSWTLLVTLGTLAIIWLVFRIVFSVLMPSGIVPEAELIQFFRNLISGTGAK